MKVRTLETTEQHVQFRNDIIEVMRKHGNLPSVEMLCLTSQFVGQLVALQDQTRYSAKVIMEMVAMNVEEGNRAAIENIFGGHGGNA